MDTRAPSRTFALPSSLPAPKGQWFARAAQLLALQGNESTAMSTADARWGSDNGASRILKAAVAPGTTADQTWAGLLTDPGAREVFAAIRERSIMGQLSGMRRIPPATHVVLQTAGAAASWVGENQPKPHTRLTYGNGPNLKVLKLQATVVATRDLLLLSTPAAEDLFRDELLNAVTREQDTAFIDPANAGVTDVKPASITNGVTPIVSTGSPDSDIEALFAAYTGDWETATLIANGKVAAAMNGLTHPDVGARGGLVMGVPVIASRNVPNTILVLVDAAGLVYFEEGAGMDKSEHATLELADNPTTPTETTVVTSLWQNNLVALRVELFTNWARARAGCVSYVSGITW
jgi:hypothetical protein